MLDLNAIFDPDRMAFPTAMTRSELPPDLWVAWDERAAFMEYEGKLPRERAEAVALADILQQMRRVAAYPRKPV